MNNLLGFLGLNVLLPLVEAKLLSEAGTVGEAAIDRAIKLPEHLVQQACTKSGADYSTAIQMRDAAATAEANFLVYLATGASA